MFVINRIQPEQNEITAKSSPQNPSEQEGEEGAEGSMAQNPAPEGHPAGPLRMEVPTSGDGNDAERNAPAEGKHQVSGTSPVSIQMILMICYLQQVPGW